MKKNKKKNMENIYNTKSAVLFIIYKRKETTKKVFDKIRETKPKKLYVAANAPQPDNKAEELKVKQTREVIENVDWDCEVIKLYRTRHLNSHTSEIGAFNWFFEHETEGIILEDDCVPDNSFFRFCDELLEKYRDDTRIGTISGTNSQFGNNRTDYSYYFSKFGHSWGWATWKNVWDKFQNTMIQWPQIKKLNLLQDINSNKLFVNNWTKKFDSQYSNPSSWDTQFVLTLFLNNYLNIIPAYNLVKNIGTQDSAHNMENNPYVNMNITPVSFPLNHPPFFIIDRKADNYRQIHVFNANNIFKRILNRFVLNH